jgi:hypothetical protein
MMKKVLTIVITMIFLASGMKVSLDRHYCGGKLADVRISFTGKMASCGMEQSDEDCPGHPVLDKKCCEDQVSFYSITGNYYPEYFRLTHPYSERDFLTMQFGNYISVNSHNSDIMGWVLPPGNNFISGLTQPEICVFRI